MDYSASIHDAEHPAGASPWGSPGSSPQHNRTTFTANPEPPQSAYQPFGSNPPSNGLAQEHDDGGFGGGEQEYRRPDTASTDSAADTQTDGTRTDAPPPRQGQPEQHGGFDAGGQGQAPLPQQPQEPPRLSGDTVAPPGSESQSRKPAQPQFKLQAKITGLERTGRKDPILRFDIHVRWRLRSPCRESLYKPC